jgi:hypothetical protein
MLTACARSHQRHAHRVAVDVRWALPALEPRKPAQFVASVPACSSLPLTRRLTVNGFNTGDRPANNGTSVTQFSLPITDNNTIWFFDAHTCGGGGVGAINANDSTYNNMDGFTRNAIRLNGTATTSSARPTATHTGGSGGGSSGGSGSGSGNSTSTSGSNSGAERTALVGGLVALPFALAALVL